jgi:NAD(P)-dependent dehydrogenase (short-subunit alcohol dehydrogenase family)
MQAVGRFVNLARERAGRIDILITNAGGPPAVTFNQANLDMFRKHSSSTHFPLFVWRNWYWRE